MPRKEWSCILVVRGLISLRHLLPCGRSVIGLSHDNSEVFDAIVHLKKGLFESECHAGFSEERQYVMSSMYTMPKFHSHVYRMISIARKICSAVSRYWLIRSCPFSSLILPVCVRARLARFLWP